MWLGSAGPPSDSPEVIRFRMITPCLEIDHGAWGEECVSACVCESERWCYKMELIESEILSGLKWDPPASLTLRLRQRAANMTEFIKCVIKELKLSVAEHPCTLFQVYNCQRSSTHAYPPPLDHSYRFTLMFQMQRLTSSLAVWYLFFTFPDTLISLYFPPALAPMALINRREAVLMWVRGQNGQSWESCENIKNTEKDLRIVRASLVFPQQCKQIMGSSFIYITFWKKKKKNLNYTCWACLILQTCEKHTLENLFISAHVRCKWSALPATVTLIASLLSHPPGLACNEIEAFGWNDLSHPLSSYLLMCTHLTVRMRRWVEDKEAGEIAFELQR